MSMSSSSSNSKNTSISNSSTHILIFPYPAQGHMIALIDLAHQLSLRDNLTITICITPKNLSALTQLLKTHPNIQTLVLQFPSHPLIPVGIENVKELGNRGNLPVISALGNLFDPLVQWFHSHPNPPVAIISDFFLGWTLRLARQLNIVRISFFSTRLLLALVSDHCWNHIDDAQSLDVVEFDTLPRSPVFKEEHLPSICRLYKKSDPDWEFVKSSMIANLLSWGCVFNSCEALEGEYFDYLKRKMGHDRVFGVGPLCLLSLDSTSRVHSNPALKWLDGCPDSSVLYVCFGSQKVLKREQMEALASGLERSRIRFLWVVKTGMTAREEDWYGSIPDGFEERVSDRGLIVRGYAPQVSILSHKAVGGFLSHCGWNSTLEGIANGVRILAWPMEADQFVNSRLLVEDMGIAVKVCEGADSVPDSDELGRIIAESLNQCYFEVKELKDKASAAVRSGGSSTRDLDKLVQELRNLQVK